MSRQPIAIVRPSPRSRRRTISTGVPVAAKDNGGQYAVATQQMFLDDLCSDAGVNAERDHERLMDYRRQIKLVPVRREVLYYETAQGNIIPMDRRQRKMRRSRSMRDGELVAQPRANCLGLFELRPRSRQTRPRSVDASERVQLLQAVPVLTTAGCAEMATEAEPAKVDAEPEEAQSRVQAVSAMFVPVDVSGDQFERYLHLRRSMRGVEYQPVVVRRQRRHQQRHQHRPDHRSHSYDALGPQLAALHDPSRTTVPLPGHRGRHAVLQQRSPRPPSAVDYDEARRLATVKRSSSMPATPPSTCEYGSWRSTSDLPSSGTNSAQGHVKLRRTFSQRAKDFFRRSRSSENALDDDARPQSSRARSKSPFSWFFRSAGSKDRLGDGSSGNDVMTMTSSSCGGSDSLNQEPVVLRKSRDRAKKARTQPSNGSAAAELQQPITPTDSGDVTPMPASNPQPPVLASARPPTDVDCPDYMETLRALTRVLSRRHTVIPQSFGGGTPLQGIPVQKAKVWLRSGRDVIKKRRAPDRYSADAMPVAVPVQPVDPLSAPSGRVKSSGSFFMAVGSGQNERKRRSAQEAGQKAKAAFAGQCVSKVSLSHSTSEHLDKLSQQFNKAVTLRRSYRSKKADDRRSSSGNWSSTSSATARPSRASSAGAHPNLPRSMSRDSALGLHSSSIERSDSLFPTGAFSSSASTSHLASSSLSSLSTQRGGTPSEANDLDLLPPKTLLASVTEHRRSASHEDSDDVFDTTIVPGASSTETLSQETSSAAVQMRKRVPPAPPPRVDSLRHVKRGVRKVLWSDGRSPPNDSPLMPSDAWYSELLPYKSNTLPRNLCTRLRKRDSLPSGGGIDMASSWPRPDDDDLDLCSEDPPLPPPPPLGNEECKKSINFAPRASLNVFDQTAATNTCSAASTHRVLKPQARPASGTSPPADRQGEEGEGGSPRPGSPSLKQYQRLYNLNRTGQNGTDSEYEDEATMV